MASSTAHESDYGHRTASIASGDIDVSFTHVLGLDAKARSAGRRPWPMCIRVAVQRWESAGRSWAADSTLQPTLNSEEPVLWLGTGRRGPGS